MKESKMNLYAKCINTKDKDGKEIEGLTLNEIYPVSGVDGEDFYITVYIDGIDHPINNENFKFFKLKEKNIEKFI